MIHPAAAQGFARSADAYERGRPRYPQEAIDLLASRLAAGAPVLDLAAGTGALARSLHDSGFRVTAVEPVAEMRAALPAAVRALEGTAEAIPLRDGEVDAVVVGQAFHWFDGDAALAEIHRVLRSTGLLALFWNVRVLDHPIHAAIDELIGPHRGDTPSHRSGTWRTAFDRTELFAPLEEHVLPNAQELDADGLAARVGSTSFVAALDPPARDRVLARARALAGDGTVTLPYRTELLIWRRT
ncbi:MAG TPA: class I SAM-dependent methyltransferase [Thermoleophilaceae bacterium]|nr:class I SAM-dependent methyltransferase [Thermoleophilaceae bacterium]